MSDNKNKKKHEREALAVFFACLFIAIFMLWRCCGAASVKAVDDEPAVRYFSAGVEMLPKEVA